MNAASVPGRRFTCAVLVVACLWAGSAWGAAASESPARGLFVAMEAALEKEIGARMVKRPENSGDRLQRLEIAIDLRLLCRSAAAQTAALQGDPQAAARLRLRLFMDALAVVEDALARQTENLTQAQLDAAARLHELTFVEIKALKDVEGVSRGLAPVVLALTGARGDPKNLPAVRPRVARPPAQEDPAKSLAAMGEEVTRLNISVPLRQQLSVLARDAVQANAPGADPKIKDAQAYAQVIEAGMDLARGLQFNTAIAPEARLEAEVQLAEGIAMFMDPRTRAAGRKQISSMAQYRQTLGRIGSLGLTAREMDQFAPLFIWARQTPEAGAKALSALEAYVQLRAKGAARLKQPNTMTTLRRSIDELEKQVAATSAAFVVTALDVPRSGAARVADVEQQAGEMRRLVTLLTQLDEMPQTLDLLGQFKPRPTGGLERRVAMAAVVAAKAEASKERAEAIALIGAVHDLAAAAVDLGKFDINTVSPTVERKCAGGRLSALDARWRQSVMELASAAAAGNAIDPAKLARVQNAKVLQAAVQRATVLETALLDADLLARWIDWRMGPEDLKPLFIPYQEAMSAAFAAYVSDAPDAVENWLKTEKRYRGVIDLMIRAGSYRNQCAAFPTGILNLVASLSTPAEGAPFAQERYAAFSMDAYRSLMAAGETAAAEQVLAAFFKRHD